MDKSRCNWIYWRSSSLEHESTQQADKSCTPFHTRWKFSIPVSTLTVWNERRNALTQFARREKKNKRRSLNTLNLFCYYGKRRNVPETHWFFRASWLVYEKFPHTRSISSEIVKNSFAEMIAQASSEIVVSSPLALNRELTYEVSESAGRFIGGRVNHSPAEVKAGLLFRSPQPKTTPPRLRRV